MARDRKNDSLLCPVNDSYIMLFQKYKLIALSHVIYISLVALKGNFESCFSNSKLAPFLRYAASIKFTYTMFETEGMVVCYYMEESKTNILISEVKYEGDRLEEEFALYLFDMF